jgi:threonine aldolase
VFFDVSGLVTTAEAFNDLLMARGVKVSALGKTRVRAVTHLDVDRNGMERAIQAFRAVFS